MGKMRKAYKILVEKSEEIIKIERRRHKKKKKYNWENKLYIEV
jgi:hypothetical protein